MTPIRLLAAAVASAPLLVLSAPASAASSYDACTGFITTLPTTVSTQGVWCFNKDLSSAISSGNAITVAVNNVTIDCNSFKLGGLGAGSATETIGIFADGRSNTTIRDCNIRGFKVGAVVGSELAGGHRIERNRFEANTGASLLIEGDGSVVSDNQIIDTGGTTGSAFPYTVAIATGGRVDVLDNHITGVDGTSSLSGLAVGVLVDAPAGAAIGGNRIGGLYYDAGGAYGVAILEAGAVDIRDNSFAGGLPGSSVACAASGEEGPQQFLYANALMMGEPSGSCQDGGDNYGWVVAP
jgi:hypothetical protein